ncbi:SRPBCC family protein [Methylocystis parvus]|uniref:SRPBCC family protein n=1 Tax=Methylocystis parvus TaxID=134 RepID=UPI003C789682
MGATVNITKRIDAPADKVWAAIAGIGGLDRWFPIISACRVEGEGVGATRIMTLADGAEMRDRIVEIDAGARRLRYERPTHPFPVTDYRGVVEVDDDGEDSAVLCWTVRFEADEAHREEMLKLIETAISEGVDGLRAELEA